MRNFAVVFGLVAVAALFVVSTTTGVAYTDDGKNDKKFGKQSTLRGIGTGSFICADGAVITDIEMNMSFSTRENEQPERGHMSMDKNSFNMFDNARLYDGKIKKNAYQIEGILFESSRPLCNDPAPVVINISGECGINVQIDLTTTSGIRGTFTGNVACV